MLICTPRRPAARRDRAARRSRSRRTPTRPPVTHVGPGGQAANVAAWVGDARRARRGSSASAATTTRARSRRAGLAQRGVELLGPVVAGRHRRHRLARRAGRRADDGLRPRRRPGAARRTSSTRPGSPAATTSTSPATRCCASPIDGAALEAAGARAGRRRARERRPLRRGAGSATSAPARFRARLEELGARRRLRERGRGARSSAGRSQGRPGSLKRGAARRVASTALELPAQPVAAVVDATGAGDALAAGCLVGGPSWRSAAALRCVSA